ncbi:glutamate--cysteine ligase [Citricoccus sp. SGAir0253]|uniref:glutamate--cysteine ligase n=1 Tax=Citricoccus sp. SGAir0253 TaxID=2567881 RepID=UPI0010CD01E9|nr:glutamate--cysteine ligase [Citricoccus sp. SGAir0253]QCU78713.1 glutamate--cysteine ligase [Citricoccus sp. SGAir0253]
MGTEVESSTYTRSERTRYRERLEASLEELKAYLAAGEFSDAGRIGLELELNLVDEDHQPAPLNHEVLAAIDDPAFQTELGRYNIELNHPSLTIHGHGLKDLEESLRAELDRADDRAVRAGAHLYAVGILPTLDGEDLAGEGWISEGNRYAALNTAVLEARGEDILIDIEGPEHLSYYAKDIAPESTCTSMQLHLEVSRERFGPVWNAAQSIAGPQVALSANSPMFLGARLWAETRIPVFQQAVDTRGPELARQGVRPRVWFGERWIQGIEDLFEENIAFFPALLPERPSPEAAAPRASGAPALPELLLHNGTVYRWNRPIFDPGRDERTTETGTIPALPANLRVENRLLPAGPTVVDMVANAAFFFGLVRYLVDREENPWERMSFAVARTNFYECARHGLNASVYWPGYGDLPVTELLDRHLLPAARHGLELLDVDDAVADGYLDVLTGRTRTGQNGSTWMTRSLARLEDAGLSRGRALARLVRDYGEHMRSGEPVHTWPLP